MAWTRERIVAALHDWTRLVGSPPRSYEWAPASARVLGRESLLSRLWASSHPRWPSTATVVRHFGTWNSALSEAGLPLRRPPGAPASGRAERIELAQRLARGRLTSAEIAAILDV